MTTTAGRSGLVPVNGIELWYEIHGDGKPLVLLHGAFGSVGMFGRNVEAIAAGRQVVGVDLPSHGHSPTADRPLRFETIADDVAALIRSLGLDRDGPPDVMGFSLGGGVALRLAIQHPELVGRLILVSTVTRSSGWHPEQAAVLRSMRDTPGIADMLGASPLGAAYRAIAPRPEDWPTLVDQVTTLTAQEYDWTAEAAGLQPATMLVVGDADGMPPRHALELFERLGGGQRDASWDRSGMTRHRLAVLPGATHYDINEHPLLAATVIAYLDEPRVAVS